MSHGKPIGAARAARTRLGTHVTCTCTRAGESSCYVIAFGCFHPCVPLNPASQPSGALRSIIDQAKGAVAKFDRAEAAAAATTSGGAIDFNIGVRAAPPARTRTDSNIEMIDQRMPAKELTAKLTELRKMNRQMDRRKDELLTSSRSFVSRY